VAEAHAHGVVHRDIKPENVFLAKGKPPHGPTPKLLDFGISKVRAPDLRATEVGMMMGTPAYMAPEQVQGARDADPRSDIWALGVMMFELIAGRLPFDMQDAPALFVAIATKDAPTLLDVRADATPAVSRLVERCLRRRPDERYPTAAELGRDLRHVIDNTELEPTGKRSLPPSALARSKPDEVPDLDIPRPAAMPVIVSPSSSSLRGGRGSAEAEPPVDPRAATSLGYGAPSTELERNLAASPTDAAPPRAQSRLAPEASMPGVMLAAAPAMTSGNAKAANRPHRPTREVSDLGPIIGIAVVGLVAILTIGLLMQLAHRSEGWPLVRFAIGPSTTGALVIQGGLAFVSGLVGASYFWRGVRHWRGDLSGGPPNAIVSAVIAAGALFAAIELFSAAY
jgi:serine/threonine-protein kinase